MLRNLVPASRIRRTLVMLLALVTGLIVTTAMPAGAAVTRWTIVPTPNTDPTVPNSLFGLSCVGSSDCWAVGDVSMGPYNLESLAEHWNGTAWSIVPTPNPSASTFNAFNGVTCVSGSDCWATGIGNGTSTTDQTLAEHWNGAAWSIVPTPNPSAVSILGGVTCVASSDCWTVGHDEVGSGTLAEHWNGSAWTVVTTPALSATGGELGSVSCAGTSDCWAVGDALDLTATRQTLAEHWNGSTWSVVTTPDTSATEGNSLADVSCITGGDCWAVGVADSGGGGTGQTLAEHWNGTAWSIVPTANTSSSLSNDAASVSCVNSADCWMVGNAVSGTGTQQTLAERWNGTAWSIVPTANTSVSEVNGLASVSCLAGSDCWSVGEAASGSGGTQQTLAERETGSGYWEVAADGGIFAFGDATFYGSEGGHPLNSPVVGMAATPDGGGYWEVAADGGIFAFGDATFYGSEGGQTLNAPIVGMAATPDGHGYWEVASDGGIFAFGDATFYGSEGGQTLNAPIVGMAATPDGHGYREVASDGGIFAFGDATFFGSEGGQPLNSPVVGMDAADGGGYWEVAADGGIFAFGDATFYGSEGGQTLNAPIVGMDAADGGGYWEVASDGGIFAFGDAQFFGSMGGVHLHAPMVGMS